MATPGRPHPVSWRTSGPFLACHLIPLLAVFTGVHAADLVLLGVLYGGRVFFVTAGYHRYFAHRAFRAGRVTQFVLAFGGLTAVQKGPLWWASWHRQHHRYADTSRDPHSPKHGFWWSHVGWIMSGRYGATNLDVVDDFARFPELRFLDRYDWIGPWTLGTACYLLAGWSGVPPHIRPTRRAVVGARPDLRRAARSGPPGHRARPATTNPSCAGQPTPGDVEGGWDG